MAQLPRQAAVQGTGRRHQHRLPPSRVPKGVSTVPEGGQLRDAPADADPHWEQLSAKPMARRSPKHHRQDQIGCAGRDQQDLGVYVSIENALHCRDRAVRQQSHRQHTARQGAGDGKQQQDHSQELFLTAKGQQRQQNAHCQFGRSGGQEGPARQKHRHGINSARQRRQQVTAPPQRHPRQPGRD